MTPERRERIDALRDAASAKIEDHESQIRNGTALPIPSYRVLVIENEKTPTAVGSTWIVSIPAVPCDPFEARSVFEAVRVAREKICGVLDSPDWFRKLAAWYLTVEEKICGVLDSPDWGFELDVEQYPARLQQRGPDC